MWILPSIYACNNVCKERKNDINENFSAALHIKRNKTKKRRKRRTRRDWRLTMSNKMHCRYLYNINCVTISFFFFYFKESHGNSWRGSCDKLRKLRASEQLKAIYKQIEIIILKSFLLLLCSDALFHLCVWVRCSDIR